MKKTLKEYQDENKSVLEDYLKKEKSLYSDKKLEIINSFIDIINSEKTISINVELASLYEILSSEKYLNVFELGYSEDSIKKRYNNLSPYYKKFKLFIDMFDPEKKIKYGALNIGNLGTRYPGFGSGQICIIFKKGFTEKILNGFCLKTFSLNYYKNDGTFREKKFKEDISNWEDVHKLAFFKHSNDIHREKMSNWPFMVSNTKGWLEILIFNEILMEYFQEIRIKDKLLNHLESLIRKDDQNLEEMDLIIKRQFILITKKSERLGIFINGYKE